MHRTQIYLPKRDIAKLRDEARRRATTVSDIIRQLVVDGFDAAPRVSRRKKSEDLASAAKRINALGTHGPRDLAKHLDRYLYGTS